MFGKKPVHELRFETSPQEQLDLLIKTALQHPFFEKPDFSQEERTAFFGTLKVARGVLRDMNYKMGDFSFQDASAAVLGTIPVFDGEAQELYRRGNIYAFLAPDFAALSPFLDPVVFQNGNSQARFLEGFFQMGEPQILLSLAESVYKQNSYLKEGISELDTCTFMSALAKKYKGLAYIELKRFEDAQNMFGECLAEFTQLGARTKETATIRICQEQAAQCDKLMRFCFDTQSIPKDQAGIHTRVLQLIELPA